MTVVRALFMGSDTFSAPVLEALVQRVPGVEVQGVVTQPDRPAGRGRRLQANPVKLLAADRLISVLQPERVGSPDALHVLQALSPDLIVVASFGQILPRALLDLPGRGCLNLHPSLLPRQRGPSPIAGVILDGETQTGSTLMQMVAKMDAGPILAQRTTPIGADETAGELGARLATVSADLLADVLPGWLAGSVHPVPQDEEQATYTRLLRKEDGSVDWTQPSEILARRVRAFNPWPVASTWWGGRSIRLLRASSARGSGQPGTVMGRQGGAMAVGTGDGVLLVHELQLPGGRALLAQQALSGHPGLASAQFTREPA